MSKHPAMNSRPLAVMAAAAVPQCALYLIGFSSGGPVAGSLAASAQSAVGSVAAGSAFATMQSVAMSTVPRAAMAATAAALSTLIRPRL